MATTSQAVHARHGVLSSLRGYARRANAVRAALLGPKSVRRGRQPLLSARAQVTAAPGPANRLNRRR